MLLLQDVSINDVNEVVKKIGKFSSIFLLVCLGANAKSHFVRKNKAENKPWFDMKCREKDRVSKDVNENSHIKNQINKTDMKNASKLYKIQLNKSYCEYQDKTANIIREKSRTDPKGLWKILNNIDRTKSDVSNNVTLEQFVEYFKNLNELPENEKDQEIDFDSVDRENVHNILNSPITEEEILRVVKNLKSNKVSGYDDIVNEHIKSTINIFLPIYCKLFNIVLNSGLIPESWSEGVIFPIYKNKGDTKDPTSSDNSHNLSFRTEVNVLLGHDTNVIGLYELGSLVSPLFL